MRVLVASRSDSASSNIRDRLVEAGDWQDTGHLFRDAPVLGRGADRLVEVEGPSIHDEGLGDDLAAMAWPVEAVWFLSRHRAESGQPSLTVHPVGNHHAATFGGRPGALCPAAPRDMGALLRRLHARRGEAGLPHSVAYEATHHGPLLAHPTLFVELGSDDEWYEHRPGGEVLARAVTDVLDGLGAARFHPADESEGPGRGGPGPGALVPGALGQGTPTPGGPGPAGGRVAADAPAGGPLAARHGTAMVGVAAPAPVLVGVGGGHYAPRHTDLALAGRADMGHLVPAYAVTEDAGPDVLRRAWEATPGADAVHVHKKGLKGPQRQRVQAWLDELGYPVWSAGEA